ncbi:hypothetical protein HUA78_36060 [Myxococcus sp. CA033]|uniref:hypothetical protein n=1 Tax=Myxococcus sp. CA033 TaxID=2741516 RepID=UPI00157ADE60|nr:hypothetical protein [Myxococcus sp. CA033]NTX39867.1 hypothetical protein [Myxococcus sp. CA033]
MIFAWEEKEDEKAAAPAPWWRTWTGAGVAAVFAACTSASATYYNIKLAEIEKTHQIKLAEIEKTHQIEIGRQKAKVDINILYLGLALDITKPAETRQQLLRFLAKEGEENQLKDWAKEELANVDRFLELKKQLETKEREAASLKRNAQEAESKFSTLQAKTKGDIASHQEEREKAQRQIEVLTAKLAATAEESIDLRQEALETLTKPPPKTSIPGVTFQPPTDARKGCDIRTMLSFTSTVCMYTKLASPEIKELAVPHGTTAMLTWSVFALDKSRINCTCTAAR